MKKAVILIVSLCMTVTLMAQESGDSVKKGTVLTLGPVSATGYQHINLPKKNFIIKRGAIANFNSLEGQKVMVEEVLTKNGETVVSIKRKDGLNFFRFWPTATTNLERALAKGELKLTTEKKKSTLDNG